MPTIPHKYYLAWKDKDAIDGLNNKLIDTLQEDGLICCMNKANVLVRPEDMRMYSSETLKRSNIVKIVLRTGFDLTIAQVKSKVG